MIFSLHDDNIQNPTNAKEEYILYYYSYIDMKKLWLARMNNILWIDILINEIIIVITYLFLSFYICGLQLELKSSVWSMPCLVEEYISLVPLIYVFFWTRRVMPHIPYLYAVSMPRKLCKYIFNKHHYQLRRQGKLDFIF